MRVEELDLRLGGELSRHRARRVEQVVVRLERPGRGEARDERRRPLEQGSHLRGKRVGIELVEVADAAHAQLPRYVLIPYGLSRSGTWYERSASVTRRATAMLWKKV